jgi:hypothetical protein
MKKLLTTLLATIAMAETDQAHMISQPVDHFGVSYEGATFNQQYWIDDSNYVQGGPIYLIVCSSAQDC